VSALTKPCPNCPFRNDRPTYLRHERAEEIAGALRSGGGFPCHETTRTGYDGENHWDTKSKWCSGAIAVMERSFAFGAIENQMLRINERLAGEDLVGAVDVDGAPVFGDLDEWVEAHEQ